MNTTTADTAVLVELEWWDRRTGAELVEHTRQALTAADITTQPLHVYNPLLLDYSPHGDGECSLWISVRTGHTVAAVATVIRSARIRVKSAQPCPTHLITGSDDELADWQTAERVSLYAAR